MLMTTYVLTMLACLQMLLIFYAQKVHLETIIMSSLSVQAAYLDNFTQDAQVMQQIVSTRYQSMALMSLPTRAVIQVILLMYLT